MSPRPALSAIPDRAAGSRRARSTLLPSLDREWVRRRTRPRDVARARSWCLVRAAGDRDDSAAFGALGHSLQSLDDLVDAMHLRPHRDPGVDAPVDRDRLSPDAVIRMVLEQARHDELAGRVVLQRILPTIVRRAARWRTDDGTHPIDLAISSGWVAIGAFDPARRPSDLATALATDAIWDALRRSSRRRRVDTPISTERLALVPADQGRGADRVAAEPDDLAAVLALAGRYGVEDEQLELVRLLAASRSLSEVATELGVTTRTVRNRRDAAVVRIRAALAAA